VALLKDEQGRDGPRVAYLADHRKYIPRLARWAYDQWREFLSSPERGIDQVLDSLRARLNHDRLPLTLVLLDGDTLLGAVSLKIYDMEDRADLSPWLAGLFVNPDFRGRGYGGMLVGACEEKAVELGMSALHLFTPDAEEYYLPLGWSVMERPAYRGRMVSIMKKDLARRAD